MAMEKQMELFADGGLMDEGGMVDEESGNEVPPGSLREEVRDDIPANLSEGEFVMPADAVRYHGLDKMMALRQEAKIGLKRMEQMGMMGNSDEAILPDDIPFDINDLEMEEEQGELNFAVGGAVPTPGFTGIGGYTAPTIPTTGFTPYVAPPPIPTTGMQQTAPQVPYTTAVGTSGLPTFQQTVGGTPGQYDELKTYVNDAGQILQIPFKNGQPIYPIPEGYKLKTDDVTSTTTTPTTTTTAATQQDKGDGDKTPQEIAEEEAQRQMVKDRKAAAKELGYTKEQGIGDALLGLTPLGYMMSNPEVGTILADGTIADGQGNSFDPITGKQVGYTGGLIGNIANVFGIQKSEAEKFGLPEGSQIPEASLAGLKSQMGEKGIQAALSGADADAVSKSIATGYESPISQEMIDMAVKAGLGNREEIMANIEATKPGTARVETTLGQTATATPTTAGTVGETATKAVKTSYENLNSIQKEMVDSYAPKTLNQKAADILGIEIDAKSRGRGLTPVEQSMVNQAVTDDLMTPRDARSRLSTDEITFRDIESRTAPTPAQRAEAARIDREERGIFDDDIARAAAREEARIDREERGIFDDDVMSPAEAQAAAGRAREARGQTRTESFEARQDYQDNVSSYESRGYSSSAARSAAANKTRADDRAMAQTGDYSGRTSAVTDSKGNPVTSGDGSVVTNTAPSGDSGPSDDSCVIATHAVSTGGFSAMDKAKAEMWCTKKYHGKWYGEAFRRGYRFMGNRAIEKGNAHKHYQEFKDFVSYGRGIKKGIKAGANYYYRTLQFFIVGLLVK